MKFLQKLIDYLRFDDHIEPLPSVDKVKKEAKRRGLPFEIVAEEYRLEHIRQIRLARQRVI